MQTCDTVNEHHELSVDMQAALIVFFSVVIGCQCQHHDNIETNALC